MRQLAVWIGVVVLLGCVAFSGVCGFDHFWQEWEFLAASTAWVYNLFFAIAVFVSRDEKGEGTLHEALKGDRVALKLHLWLRVSAPASFFSGTWVVIILDSHIGSAPVPTQRILLKLLLTLFAFFFIFLGDLITLHQLRCVADTDDHAPIAWTRYFKHHAWLIDFPFVFAYAVLFFIYVLYQYDPANIAKGPEFALLLQGFVGGASALEMMVQSAIHGFSEIGD